MLQCKVTKQCIINNIVNNMATNILNNIVNNTVNNVEIITWHRYTYSYLKHQSILKLTKRIAVNFDNTGIWDSFLIYAMILDYLET